MTAGKFKPLIFSVSGFALSNVANIFIFMILDDFVACMILLCNHKRTVYEKPYTYLEPMCASENCQWCGEPYFAVFAISIGDILPQSPRKGKHKSLRI
jgi:hypothetical protein